MFLVDRGEQVGVKARQRSRCAMILEREQYLNADTSKGGRGGC